MEEVERRGGSGEDHISDLPDELLHDILVRLYSAQAAARTSVLSRRWRHVWAHLPELRLAGPRAAAAAPASFLDAVDGALAGYMAPTLGHLSISLEEDDVSITAGRVAPWLQFAAEHMVAEIHLYLPPLTQFSPTQPLSIEPEVIEDEKVLELTAWEGAKQIDLSLTEVWRVRPQASGMFKELTSLEIFFARMRGAELTALVCTQCPCLTDLHLGLDLIAVSDVSLHSNRLRSLDLLVTNTRRLEVVAPNLEKLSVYSQPVEAHISAPKLVRLAWHCAYDPRLHRIADVGRCLRLLETSQSSAAVLTKQFDEVDELKLGIFIGLDGATGYETFLNQTNKLPKCKSIDIRLLHGKHALLPCVLQLLRNCSSTKKLSVLLLNYWSRASRYSCPASCPCGLEESRNIDGVALSSVEEIEISEFTHSLESMELVEFLTRNAAILKRLIINYTTRSRAIPPTKEVCDKIRSMCRRNVEVKFHVFRDAKLAPFD